MLIILTLLTEKVARKLIMPKPLNTKGIKNKEFPDDDWLKPYREGKDKGQFIKKVNENLIPPIRRKGDIKPKQKTGTMRKIFKTVKRFGGLVAGLLGTGGGVAAGLDINTALLIGVTAAVALISGDLAFAKEFRELFDDDPSNDPIGK